jgi:hypothetical protein
MGIHPSLLLLLAFCPPCLISDTLASPVSSDWVMQQRAPFYLTFLPFVVVLPEILNAFMIWAYESSMMANGMKTQMAV